MARTIIGELIVRLIDGVTGEAKKVVGSIDKIDQAARRAGKGSGKGFDDLASSLKRAETAARGLAASGAGIGDWGSRFNNQLQRLRASAGDIDRIRDSWRRLQDTMRTGHFDDAFRTSAVKRWKAETIGSLIAVRHEAMRTDKALGEKMAGAATIRRWGRNAAIAAGIGGGAYGVGRVARSGIKDVATLTQEQARQYLVGLTPAQQAAASAKANVLSAKYPSVGQVAIMTQMRNLYGTLGDWPHAMEMIEDITKAQVVLGSLRGPESAGHDLLQLMRGLEGAGMAADPGKFQRMLSAFVKGASLFGETLTGADYRTYMQRSKMSKYGLSEEYLAGVVPTMIQHEGAQQFGVSQATAFNSLIGGRQTKAAKAALKAAGLIDDNLRPIDMQTFISKPHQWAWTNLKSRLEKEGGDLSALGTPEGKEAAVEKMTKWFSNRNAAEYFAGLLANEPVIRKDIDNLKRAKGIDAAEEMRNKDLFVASKGVHEQLINVLQNAIAPYADRAAAALNSVAEALAHVSDAVKNNKLWGESTAPAATALAGAASVTAGAGASALGFPAIGALLSGVGALPLIGGWHWAGRAVKTELLKEVQEQSRKGTGFFAPRPFGDATFGAGPGFRRSGAVEQPGGFWPPGLGARPPGFTGGPPVRDLSTRPGELPEGSGLIEAAESTGARIREALSRPPDPSAMASSMQSLAESVRAGGERVLAEGASIMDRLRALFSQPLTARVGISGPAAPGLSDGAPTAPGRASGGRVYAGELYRIAEHRDEYFTPGEDGTIIPDADRLGGGGEGKSRVGPVTISPTFHMTISGVQNAADVAAKVRGLLEDEIDDHVRGLFADYGFEVA